MPSHRDHNMPGLLSRGQPRHKPSFATLKTTEVGKVPDVKKPEKYSPRHGPSQNWTQTMQAFAALPAPQLLQLPEQLGHWATLCGVT